MSSSLQRCTLVTGVPLVGQTPSPPAKSDACSSSQFLDDSGSERLLAQSFGRQPERVSSPPINFGSVVIGGFSPGLAPERRAGREAPAAAQSKMSGTGMTQEMEALAFEGSQGFDLTDEEAEESARLYDEAQVVLQTEHDRNPAKTA